MMKPILWKYFFRRNAAVTSLVWLALTLLLVLFDILRSADDAGLLTGVLLAFLRAPQFALITLPFACALGAALAICGMVTAGEMPVLRAAGMSPLAVASYNAASMLIFVAASLFIGEVLLPAGADTAAALKDDARTSRALWLREGGDYIRIGQLRLDGGLEDIVIYHTESAVLLSITAADSADFTNEVWHLKNIHSVNSNGGETLPTRKWSLAVHPSSFEIFFKKPRDMALSAVYTAAGELTAAGQDARSLWRNLWRRWEALLALPLLAAAAVWMVDGARSRVLTPLAVAAATLLTGMYYFGAEIAVQTALLANFGWLLLLPPLALAGVVAVGIVRPGR